MQKIKSPFMTLRMWDIIKGAVLAVITGVLSRIAIEMDVLPGEMVSFPTVKRVAAFALISFIGYLLKNYLSNSTGTFGPEPKTPVDETTNPAIGPTLVSELQPGKARPTLRK